QVRADTLHVPVSPYFEWIRLRSTTGEAFDLIRWAAHNVHAAAIGLPARPAGAPIAFVGIGDPAIMFFFGLVFDRAWRRIAPEPELFDEFPPLLVSSQFLERSALFIGDDISHVLIHPPDVRRDPGAVGLRLRGGGTLPGWLRLPRGQGNRGDYYEDHAAKQ